MVRITKPGWVCHGQEKDGKPLALFVGHGYTNIHTLSMMFCQDGDADADCVTTVR